MEVLYMNEFVKSLDRTLNYLTYETHEHNIIITVESECTAGTGSAPS